MFLDVLEICSKFTGEYQCRSAISIKLQSNFIEIILCHTCSPVNLLHIFRTTFFRNTSGRLLLKEVFNWNYFDTSYNAIQMSGLPIQTLKNKTFFSSRILFSNKCTCSITREDENKQAVK